MHKYKKQNMLAAARSMAELFILHACMLSPLVACLADFLSNIQAAVMQRKYIQVQMNAMALTWIAVCTMHHLAMCSTMSCTLG